MTAMGGGGAGRFAPTEGRVGAVSSATGIARVFLGTFPGLAPASPSLLGPGASRALGVDARRRDVVLLSSPSPRPRISWRKNDIPSFLRGPPGESDESPSRQVHASSRNRQLGGDG